MNYQENCEVTWGDSSSFHLPCVNKAVVVMKDLDGTVFSVCAHHKDYVLSNVTSNKWSVIAKLDMV